MIDNFIRYTVGFVGALAGFVIFFALAVVIEDSGWRSNPETYLLVLAVGAVLSFGGCHLIAGAQSRR